MGKTADTPQQHNVTPEESAAFDALFAGERKPEQKPEQKPAEKPVEAPSDTPAETPETPAEETSSTPEDLTAEVEKWRALARKHEARAKSNSAAAAELQKLRAAQMSDQEKAIEEAKAAGRAEAKRDYGARLVDAEIKSAAAGLALDLDKLLPNLDRAKFLTEDGDVDTAGVKSLIEALTPTTPRKKADLGQGNRGTRPPKTGADLFGDFLEENFN